MKVYLSDAAKLTDGDLPRFLDALPPKRRACAERFKNPIDRAASAVGFLLVAKALRDADPSVSPSDWAIGEHGKPRLPGSDLHFSLSHADGLCAAVTSRRPIGLDVERCSRDSVPPPRSRRAKTIPTLPSRSGPGARRGRRKTGAGSDRN